MSTLAIAFGCAYFGVSVALVVLTGGMIMMAFDAPWHTLSLGERLARGALCVVLAPAMLVYLLFCLLYVGIRYVLTGQW